MLIVGRRQRRAFAEMARRCSIPASALPFLLAVRFAWSAFSFPLELGSREGTSWLHALAKRAGVDIYDSTSLAFVNMAHGPLDPILKGWFATYFSFLPASMVTRLFVFLLPFFLLGSAYTICRKKWVPAFLSSAAVYFFLASFTPMLIVGRSDATALCGLAICLSVANGLLTAGGREWREPAYLRREIVLGASSGLVFFTCWRYLPALVVLLALVLVKQLGESQLARTKCFVHSCGLFAAGFLLVFAPILMFELHASFQLFYQRFFGFFSDTAGWSSHHRGTIFHLIPDMIMSGRRSVAALILATTLSCIYLMRKDRAELRAWLMSLALLWIVTSYGYYKNEMAGGVHYFCPFFLVLWFFFLRAIRQRGEQPIAHLAMIAIALLVATWGDLAARQREVEAMRSDARAFLREVARRAAGRAIVSEDVQFFKKKYRGERVDMGDTASAMARSGYYGAVFTRTFENYESDLKSNPPPLIMAGCLGQSTTSKTVSPELRELLDERYTMVLRGPSTFIAWGGGYPALFQRNEP